MAARKIGWYKKKNLNLNLIFRVCNQKFHYYFFFFFSTLGLTPEMLFRAADKEYTGALLLDDFRNFLLKLKLGLSPAQISRILFLCNEDCSGIIRREDYY